MNIAVNPAPPLPRAPISRRRKAAIIVRLLLGEGATLPLSALPENLQAALTEEIGAMRYIDGDTLRAVVAEFLEELEKIGLVFPGGIEGALALLDGHISDGTAAEMRATCPVPQAAPVDPWGRIATQEAEALLPLARAESIEVTAVLLSKLPVERAAQILGQLPGERARRVACAVSQVADVAPQTVARIGRALLDELEAATPAAAGADAPEVLIAAILNASTASTRDAVLAGMEEDDAALAERVRKTIFTFADIPARLNPRDVPNVTRGVAPEVLVTALAGATGKDAATAEFLLSNLSQRMAAQLREDMGERGAVRPRDAETAQMQLIAAIREGEATGEIRLIRTEETDDD